MPKLKVHKGTAKRMKETGGNNITRRRAFGNHNLSKKSHGRKRAMKVAALVQGKMLRNVKRALGI